MLRYASILLAMLSLPIMAHAQSTRPADRAAPTAPTSQPGEYEARVFKDAAGKTLPYRLLKPAKYDPVVKYPLVLFLHGAGERGADNRAQLLHGAPVLARPEMMASYPCFVVAPQCPAGSSWAVMNRGGARQEAPAEPTEPMRLALALLAELKKEFSIDADRLYVTGLSMGGFGTWDAIVRHPDMFAAAAPICGGGDESKAAAIAKLPIWCFHGDKDTTVPTARSRDMIAAIKKAGGEPKYSELPGVGHSAWVPAYSNPELWKWLFAQKRSGAGKPTTQPATLREMDVHYGIYLMRLDIHVTITPAGLLHCVRTDNKSYHTNDKVTPKITIREGQFTADQMADLARLFVGWETLSDQPYYSVVDGPALEFRYGEKRVTGGGAPRQVWDAYDKILKLAESMPVTNSTTRPDRRPVDQ